MNKFFNFNFKKKEKLQTEDDTVSRILNDKSDFYTVETYKSIRTNIMFSLPKTEKGKVIVITSSAPGDGKTTTSTNLAITFAQMGTKTVLIDCDLRKSRIHRYLGLENGAGVSNVLCGFKSLDNVLKKDVRPNLDVITAGEIPPNPAELLESDEFEKFVDELKERYEYIFIDTPPVTVVTDATVAMKHSMGTVIVVRQDVTTFDIFENTVEAINKTGVKVLGVIMVGCERGQKKYGYYKKGNHKYGYYKYGYKYGYGYQYGDNEEND